MNQILLVGIMFSSLDMYNPGSWLLHVTPTQQRLKAPLGNPVIRLTILFIPQSDIFGACCCRYFQLATGIPQKVTLALFRYECQI